MEEDATESSFDRIWDFIKSKGYDCINYRVYEAGYRLRAIILNHDSEFDYSTLTELKRDEKGFLYEEVEDEIEEPVKEISVNDLFQEHDELNPKIWEGKRLKTKIRDGAIKVAEAFREYTKIPFRIVDIVIVGSNAGYNYNDTSDLDIHIIADFDSIDSNNELVAALLNALKSSFNEKYDIDFGGINVELYVEDMKTNVASNGIYSVKKNKWLKEPQKMNLKNIDLEPLLEPVEAEIMDALNSNDYDKIVTTIDDLYYNRKLGIQLDGELSVANLIFKAIRAKGLLQQLKDKRDALKAKELCVEKKNINKRALINESYVSVKDNCGITLYEGPQSCEPFKDYKWLYNDAKSRFECDILGSGLFTKEIIG